MLSRKLGSFMLGLFVVASSFVFGQVPISILPQATTPLTGNELVPIVQSGTTKKATTANFALAGLGLANPTGVVGLTPVNGVLTTGMRSDAAPPLSQAIAPTWSGTHLFEGVVSTQAGVASGSLGTDANGGSLVLVNPTNATADQHSWELVSQGAALVLRTNNDAFTQSRNILQAQRTGLGITSMSFGNTTDNNSYSFQGTGALSIGGGVTVGSPTGGNKGTGTINMTGCFVNNVACDIGGFTGFANPTASVGLTAVNGSATTGMRSDAAPALSQAISPTWTGNHTWTPAAGTNTFNGVAAANALRINGNATTGSSLGLFVAAGTNSSDRSLLIQNAAATTAYLQVSGDGGATLGSPTGGDKGLGTLNMTGCFVNNVACDIGGFTGFANPTAVVGLTAVNGSATTGMRSDGAPALSQSIAPTWSGQHLFTGALNSQTAAAGASIGVDASGGATLWANSTAATDAHLWECSANTAAFTCRTLNDAFSASRNALIFQRSGLGLTAVLLSNVTDNAPVTVQGTGGLNVNNAFLQGNGTNTFLRNQTGGGNLFLGTGAVNYWQIDSNGKLSNNTNPISGNSMTVNGSTTGNIFTAANAQDASAGLLYAGATKGVRFGTSTTTSLIEGVDSSGVGSFQPLSLNGSTLSFGTGSSIAARMTINGTGNATLNAPTAGVGLTVNGLANSYAENAVGSGTSGQSFGIRIQAGTTSADAALGIANAAGSTTLFAVNGDGGVTVGSPTGGDQGLGTVNMTGCFVNGVACGNSGVLSSIMTTTTALTTATLANDPNLPAIALVSGHTYEVFGFMYWRCTAASSGLQFNLTYSGTNTFSAGFGSFDTTGGAGNVQASAFPVNNLQAACNTAGAFNRAQIHAIIKTSSSGNLIMQDAQAIASGTTTVQLGSYLKVTQLN